DEIAPLTNYVAAGGFLFIGGSAFTRTTNGTARGDFAFASQMGVHTATVGLNNWVDNSNFFRQFPHRIVSHVPDGSNYLRMASFSEENSWGTSPQHEFHAPHDLWKTQVGDATVVALGDANGAATNPYLTVKQYGKGYFIYDAAFQPMIAH